MTRTTCLIPARGGSVRLPRKNIRMFHGKPIIAYSIENALKSGLFDDVVVSTDDDEIANVAAKYGALYVRRDPDDGTKGTQELAGEYLRSPGRERIGMCCVLYPCAPLLTWRDLVDGWRKLLGDRTAYIYAVDRNLDDVGGFYWGLAQAFREGLPLNDSCGMLVQSIDINTEEDWQRAERMYEALHRKNLSPALLRMVQIECMEQGVPFGN